MSLEHSLSRGGKAVFGGKPRLISDKETAAILGCSRATVWRRASDGTLPKPVRIGNITRWVDAEIYDCVVAAMASREEAA